MKKTILLVVREGLSRTVFAMRASFLDLSRSAGCFATQPNQTTHITKTVRESPSLTTYSFVAL